MKTHIRMIIASAIVIALALTAVSGITYSWFSDTETTNISVTTATMDLKVVVDKGKIYNFGKIDSTEVALSDSNGNAVTATTGDVENPYSITVSNLCANAFVSIPYTIQYKSDINTVARVTATMIFTCGGDDGEDDDAFNEALGKITLGFNGEESKPLSGFTSSSSIVTNEDGTRTIEGTADLLPWTVNEATTGDDYMDLLTDNNLTIGTTDDFELSGLTFTITLKSEIYQRSYVYTSNTHEYTDNATFTDDDDGRTLTSEKVYEIPDNGLVDFDKVVYYESPTYNETTGDVATDEEGNVIYDGDTAKYFTNVLLDFTKCTGFSYFAMSFDYGSEGANIEIIPLTFIDTGGADAYYKEYTTAAGDITYVTISLNCEGSLADLKTKDSAIGEGSTDEIILNRTTSDGGAFVIINVPIGELRILDADYIN